MCGIFGILGCRPFSGAEIAKMGRLLRHRGPDDEGFVIADPSGLAFFGGADTPEPVLESRVPYAPRQRLNLERLFSQGGVALGHRRLSILDLSPQGHQPMVYRNRFWLVFNGEVYNYLELREELRALGHRFDTESDTEVVLAAYAEWGPDCLSRFNGMWGMAILDAERATLFLARDRFGVKPLYYRVAAGRFAFASEIKAFTALSDWSPRANLARLLDLLVWSVLDHGPETLFEGVHQVPAGHYLLLDVGAALRGGVELDAAGFTPRRWYELAVGRASPGDHVAGLQHILKEAVRLRLRADVPVGSCLSGGLDSSSIVCLMSGLLARQGGGHVKTFTARSAEAAFDESGYAGAVAAHAGADGTVVTPEPSKLFDELTRLTWHQDEPFLSSSIFAQWCVFEAARRRGVVVMLDGQGADETLCGYRGFFGAYLAGLLRQGRLTSWAREVGALRRQIGFSPARSVGYTLAYLTPGALGLLGRFDNRSYSDRTWLHARHAPAFRQDPVRDAGGRAGSVQEMSVAQVAATNLPMLLHWEDRNSMAFSVEARVPFLDYRVVEFVLALPDAEKLSGGVSKAVLRKAMRGTVPDLVLDRRDKMGFLTAEPAWVRSAHSQQFRDALEDAVEALGAVLHPAILDQFDEVVAGRRPFDQRYWRALSAGRWASVFSVKV